MSENDVLMSENDIFFENIENNSIDSVRKNLLEAKKSGKLADIVKHVDENGNNAIVHAVINNADPNIIKLLNYNGVDVDMRNKKGETALFIASMDNRYDTVKMLLDLGAGIEKNLVDSVKNTKIKKLLDERVFLLPFHKEMVELIDNIRRLNPDENYIGGELTSIFEARGLNDVQKKSLLRIKNERGETILIYALRFFNYKSSLKDIIGIIINEDPKIIKTDVKGKTPLMVFLEKYLDDLDDVDYSTSDIDFLNI